MSYVPKQWITAMDLDFTAESSQTLTTDGNYTIGGKTWTKLNSTNDATAMAITNGTGLVIQPKAATNIDLSTFSAPTIRIPITNIISSFTLFMPLRIWIYESASNEAANFDNLIFGPFIYNGSYANQFTIQVTRGFNGTVNGWNTFGIVLQTDAVSTAASIPPSTNRVGMIYFPAGVFGGFSTLLTGTSVSGGAWPTFSNLDYMCNTTIPAATGAALSNSSSGAHTVSDVNLYIAAYRDNSATSFSATVARFRVDYLPLGN